MYRVHIRTAEGEFHFTTPMYALSLIEGNSKFNYIGLNQGPVSIPLVEGDFVSVLNHDGDKIITTKVEK